MRIEILITVTNEPESCMGNVIFTHALDTRKLELSGLPAPDRGYEAYEYLEGALRDGGEAVRRAVVYGANGESLLDDVDLINDGP